MSIIARFRSSVGNLFRKTRRDEDLDTELRSYAESLAQEKMREGLSPEEARRAARIELGGIEQVKEEVREGRRSMARFSPARPSLWCPHVAQKFRIYGRSYTNSRSRYRR